jgi:hypothetical protein
MDALQVAEENYDPVQMEEALGGILAWHNRFNPSFVSGLNPGLSESEIDRIEANFDYRLSDELRLLYRWRNGSNNQQQFAWYHRFLPLEEAISLIEDIRGLYEWENGWLPIFEFEREYLFVKLTETRVKSLPLYLAFPYSDHVEMYVNLTKYLATAEEVLYFPDLIEVELETGSLIKEDIDPIRDIHAKYNPNLVFPYQ